MNLTSILNYSNKNFAEFRKVLSELFPLPRQEELVDIKVEPLTNHYSLVGTAFDYLLRFILERNYKHVVRSEWISQHVADSLSNNYVISNEDLDIDKLDDLLNKKKIKNTFIKDRYKNFKETHQQYVTGRNPLDSELIKGCLLLSKMDALFRAGQQYIFDIDIESVDEQDVEDLFSLIEICDLDLFKPRNKIVLNPTFGKGSVMVGRADADLLVDNMLIDIKVTKEMKLKRLHYNQIIGYYLLSLIGGIDGDSELNINSIGIYFARHGRLETFDIDNLGSADSFERAIDVLGTLVENK